MVPADVQRVCEGLKPVPPGPGNPLGTRWMGLNAPGRQHPRHGRADLDRLQRVVLLRPNADPGCEVAVPARQRRHAGLIL